MISFASRLLSLICVAALSIWGSAADAFQEVHEWKVVPIKIYEDVPHTETKWINETQYETRETKSLKPFWVTETRERKLVTRKPVVETRERVEKKTFLRPVQVTKYRERKVQETTYRKVTKYRDEEYFVKKPVLETRYREETVTVRKPVVESMVEVTKTKTYKPVTETKTELVAEPGAIGLVAVPDYSQRPRLRYLSPGYYTDPVTGMTVYRRRGLHWAAPNAVAAVQQTPPTIVPRERTETRYVPETTESRRPIELTRMVETTEIKRVPYTVETMEETRKTRRVPYVVEEPVVRTRVERIPYTETEYREEVVTERVPYTETVMKDEVTYEPYEVQVPEWREVVTPERVAKVVPRKVTRETTRRVPRIVMHKVPVDAEGRIVGKPVPLDQDDAVEGRLVPADSIPAIDVNEMVLGEGTTVGQPFKREAFYRGQGVLSNREADQQSILVPENERQSSMKAIIESDGKAPAKADSSNSGSDAPEAKTNEPVVPSVPQPESTPSEETGDENAGERDPTTSLARIE